MNAFRTRWRCQNETVLEKFFDALGNTQAFNARQLGNITFIWEKFCELNKVYDEIKSGQYLDLRVRKRGFMSCWLPSWFSHIRSRWNGASSKFFIFCFFLGGGRENVKQKRRTKNQRRSVFIKTISKKCEDDQIRCLWRLFFTLLYDVKNSAILNTTQYQHKRLTFSTKTHKLRTGDK